VATPSDLFGRMGALACAGLLIVGCADTPQSPPADPEPAGSSAPTTLATAADYRIIYSGDAGDNTALYGLDLETGNSAPVTGPMGFAGFAVWSPDGNSIAFLGESESGSGLLVLDAATGAVDMLIEELGEPVDFSPDGSAVVFTQGTDDGRALVVHDLATGVRTPIDTGSDTDAYAHWSHADNALVFESARDGNPEIYRHEMDTGVTTRLTDNADLDEWPAPSPDGEWIAWASGTEETKDLWVMRSDGSEKRRLSEGVLFGDAVAAWSPDGSRILLSAYDGEDSALYLVDVASGEMRRVTSGTAATWR